MDWSAFESHLNQTFADQGQPAIHIVSAHSVSGGDSHQAYQLHGRDKNWFLKLSEAANLAMLETEQHSLNAIVSSQTMLCPKPIVSGIFDNQAWLLMEHLTLSSHGNDYDRGRALAHMHHTINREPQPFGWFEDNYIGRTLQKNQWSSDWIHFYGEQRLRPQLELAQLRGGSSSLYQQGVELINLLPFWFQDYQPKASLLHGDLWGGNSAFDEDGEAVIFDPASYYGDRETDLAMTELFGGFSAEFYKGYDSVFPIDKGYQQRKTLYNLYHILNHFNLFGGHYQQQALQIIERLTQQAQH